MTNLNTIKIVGLLALLAIALALPAVLPKTSEVQGGRAQTVERGAQQVGTV